MDAAGDDQPKQDNDDDEYEGDKLPEAEAEAAKLLLASRPQRIKDAMSLFTRLSKKLRVRRMCGAVRHNERWDNILRTKDLHLCLFSMIGLFVSIVTSYVKWAWKCQPDDAGDCHVTSKGISNTTEYVAVTISNSYTYLQSTWTTIIGLQIALWASSLVCLVLIVQYYKLILQGRRLEWSGLEELELIEAHGDEASRQKAFFSNSYNFWDSGMRFAVLAEVLVHTVHPNAFLEVSFGSLGPTLYELFEFTIFLRLYLVLRVLFENSDIYVFRADIVGSNKELQERNYEVSFLAAYKILFYNHPGKLIMIIALVMIVVFGFGIFVVERNNTPALADLPNCYWFVWATISTVGYGDVVVTSRTGKLITIFIAIASMLVLILFSGIVTNLLSPTREQRYIQSYLEQRDAEQEHRLAAVSMIEVAFLERRARSNAGGARGEHVQSKCITERRSPAMYAAIKRIRRARLATRNSLGAAVDPIVDTKLQEAIILGHQLNKRLHEQGLTILFLQQRLLTSTSLIKKQITAGSSVVIHQEPIEKDPVTKKHPYHKYVSTL